MHIVLSSAPTYKDIYDGTLCIKKKKVEREAPNWALNIQRGNSLYTAVQRHYTNLIYFQVRKTATVSLVRYPHTTENRSTKHSNTKIPYYQETSKIGNQREKPRRQIIIKELN